MMKFWTVSLVWKHLTSTRSFRWILSSEKHLKIDRARASTLKNLSSLMDRQDLQTIYQMQHHTRAWLISSSTLMTFSHQCVSLNISISAALSKSKKLWIIFGPIMRSQAKSWLSMSIIFNHWSSSWFLVFVATLRSWLTLRWSRTSFRTKSSSRTVPST